MKVLGELLSGQVIIIIAVCFVRVTGKELTSKTYNLLPAYYSY